MKKVVILNDCPHTGIKKGEIYETTPYQDDKVILERRIPDGFDPECTEYLYNVRIATDEDLKLISK